MASVRRRYAIPRPPPGGHPKDGSSGTGKARTVSCLPRTRRPRHHPKKNIRSAAGSDETANAVPSPSILLHEGVFPDERRKETDYANKRFHPKQDSCHDAFTNEALHVSMEGLTVF